MNTAQRDVRLIGAMLKLIESPKIRRRIEKVLLAQDVDAPPDRVMTAAETGKMLRVRHRRKLATALHSAWSVDARFRGRT